MKKKHIVCMIIIAAIFLYGIAGLVGCADYYADDDINLRSPQRTVPAVTQRPLAATPAQTIASTQTTTPGTGAPLFTSMNRHILAPDAARAMSESMLTNYKALVDAVYERSSWVAVTLPLSEALECIEIFNAGFANFLVSRLEVRTPYNNRIYITYRYTAQRQREMVDFIEGEYIRILNSIIRREFNDFERTLAVYRYFATRISYNSDWDKSSQKLEDQFLPAVDIYEALITNKGVCFSYSFLCQYALLQMNIDAFNLFGIPSWDNTQYHAWLVVRLNGNFYHIDPTWDAGRGGESLRFFGMTDSDRIQSGILEEFIQRNRIRPEYGAIKATDSTVFNIFRNVSSWEFMGNHRIRLTMSNNSSSIFNAVTMRVE